MHLDTELTKVDCQMRKVLHVGCGPKTLKNVEAFFRDGTWEEVRFDIDASVEPDLIGTLTDMSAISSESFSAIISSHNIEHLFWHEVPLALSEFKRVLSHSDGFLWLRCPNLQGAAALVAEDKLLDPAYVSGMGPIAPMDIIFGHGASIKKGNHFMAHRCGFTKTTLAQVIHWAGFKRGMVKATDYELLALATTFDAPQSDIAKLFSKLSPSS